MGRVRDGNRAGGGGETAHGGVTDLLSNYLRLLRTWGALITLTRRGSTLLQSFSTSLGGNVDFLFPEHSKCKEEGLAELEPWGPVSPLSTAWAGCRARPNSHPRGGSRVHRAQAQDEPNASLERESGSGEAQAHPLAVQAKRERPKGLALCQPSRSSASSEDQAWTGASWWLLARGRPV